MSQDLHSQIDPVPVEDKKDEERTTEPPSDTSDSEEEDLFRKYLTQPNSPVFPNTWDDLISDSDYESIPSSLDSYCADIFATNPAWPASASQT